MAAARNRDYAKEHAARKAKAEAAGFNSEYELRKLKRDLREGRSTNATESQIWSAFRMIYQQIMGK